MSVIKRILLATLAGFALAHTTYAGVLGHSGVVLHVDKYGHFSGHSTHYDYRFHPEKYLFDHIPYVDHHYDPHPHHVDDGELQEAFQLIDDDDHYHGFSYHVQHQHEDEDHHHLLYHR